MNRTFLLIATAFGLHANAQVIFQSDFEAWTGNIPNGWFGSKSSIAADSVAQVTTNPHAGSAAVGLTNSTNSHKRFTTGSLGVTDGTTYTITFWARGSGELRTGLFDGRATGFGYATYNNYVVLTSTWTQYSQVIDAANDTTGAEFILSLRNSAGPDHVVVDDVEISLGGVVNPATPHTIYEIQYTTDPGGDSPLLDSTVQTGGIVTAAYASGYWIQNGSGPWSGLFVFDNSIAPTLGDSVIVEGEVSEYNGLTEISGPSNATIVNSGNPVPAGSSIAIAQAMAEEYESVLTTLSNVTCSNADAGFGQWTVQESGGDTLLVDDLIFAYVPAPGQAFTSITGPMYYSFGERKIEPRGIDDITGMVEFPMLDASVLPNPASDALLVQWSGGTLYYNLADQRGRMVMNAMATGTQVQLDLRGLSEGMYSLTLLNEGRTRTERIVVRR